MSLRLGPLGWPEVNSLTSCRGWCCPRAELGCSPALLSRTGPGLIRRHVASIAGTCAVPGVAWMTSASSEGQEQASCFPPFSGRRLLVAASELSVSEARLQVPPHFQAEVLSRV